MLHKTKTRQRRWIRRQNNGILTYLSWSLYRGSLGIAGSFLKSYSELGGKKVYYKLSNFDKVPEVIHRVINAPDKISLI